MIINSKFKGDLLEIWTPVIFHINAKLPPLDVHDVYTNCVARKVSQFPQYKTIETINIVMWIKCKSLTKEKRKHILAIHAMLLPYGLQKSKTTQRMSWNIQRPFPMFARTNGIQNETAQDNKLRIILTF